MICLVYFLMSTVFEGLLPIALENFQTNIKVTEKLLACQFVKQIK